MKLVFFDLRRDTTRAGRVALFGAAVATPAALVAPPRTMTADENLYYNNKVMNYFGDSFHVTSRRNRILLDLCGDQGAGRIAWWSKVERKNPGPHRSHTEQGKVYKPVEIKLDAFQTDRARSRLPAPTTKALARAAART